MNNSNFATLQHKSDSFFCDLINEVFCVTLKLILDYMNLVITLFNTIIYYLFVFRRTKMIQLLRNLKKQKT